MPNEYSSSNPSGAKKNTTVQATLGSASRWRAWPRDAGAAGSAGAARAGRWRRRGPGYCVGRPPRSSRSGGQELFPELAAVRGHLRSKVLLELDPGELVGVVMQARVVGDRLLDVGLGDACSTYGDFPVALTNESSSSWARGGSSSGPSRRRGAWTPSSATQPSR